MKTLDEIKMMDKELLSPADICGVLGCDPQTIRVTARQNPGGMGFPFVIMGRRVKIPRVPFLRFMGVNI